MTDSSQLSIVFSGPGLERAYVNGKNFFKISITDQKGNPVFPPNVTIRITSLEENEIVSVQAIIGDDDKFWITYVPHKEGDYIIELLQQGARIGHDRPYCVYAGLKDNLSLSNKNNQPQQLQQLQQLQQQPTPASFASPPPVPQAYQAQSRPTQMADEDSDEEERNRSLRRVVPRDQSINYKFTDFDRQGLKKVTKKREEKKVKIVQGENQKLKFIVENDKSERAVIPIEKLRVLVTPTGGITDRVHAEVDPHDGEISLNYPDYPEGCLIEVFQDDILIETLRIPGIDNEPPPMTPKKNEQLTVALDIKTLRKALMGDSARLAFAFENEKGNVVSVNKETVRVKISPPNSKPFFAQAFSPDEGKSFAIDFRNFADGCELEIYENQSLVETLRIPKIDSAVTLNNFLAILGADDLDIEEEESIAEKQRPKQVAKVAPANSFSSIGRRGGGPPRPESQGPNKSGVHASLVASPEGQATIKLRDNNGNAFTNSNKNLTFRVRPVGQQPFLAREVQFTSDGNFVLNNLVVLEDYVLEILEDDEVLDRVLVPRTPATPPKAELLDFDIIPDKAALRKIVKGEGNDLVFKAKKDGQPYNPTQNVTMRVTIEGSPPITTLAKPDGNWNLILNHKIEPTHSCTIDVMSGDDVKETFNLKFRNPNSSTRLSKPPVLPKSTQEVSESQTENLYVSTPENPPAASSRVEMARQAQEKPIANKAGTPHTHDYPAPVFETAKKGLMLEVITHYPRKQRRVGETFDVFVIVRDKKTKERHSECKDLIKCHISGPTRKIHRTVTLESIRTRVEGQYLMQFTPNEIGKYKCMVKFDGQNVQWKQTRIFAIKKIQKEPPTVTATTTPEAKKGPNPGEVELELNQMTMRTPKTGSNIKNQAMWNDAFNSPSQSSHQTPNPNQYPNQYPPNPPYPNQYPQQPQIPYSNQYPPNHYPNQPYPYPNQYPQQSPNQSHNPYPYSNQQSRG
eukprot:TRINITY_DN232_c0_g1_i3.p1 TRINITY_DN232_c0_g1~~TRINITY_DN232_c0_g1_i3.p1  ORF type:complete len:968 (-),score=228.80 TRINITY_DN232_c0_g1_i3:124-3027(-)